MGSSIVLQGQGCREEVFPEVVADSEEVADDDDHH
jgi:hypothetical protein